MYDFKLKELARQERNRYSREWRARNKDKVREANRRYWEKRAAKQATEKGGDANAAQDAHD